MSKYRHGEAFALMWYACKCGHRERIWNSRDGVTPFGGVLCPSCGGKGLEGLSHVHWELDDCNPEHKLVDGQRFFRDGTVDDAIRITEMQIKAFADSGMPAPPDIVEQLRAHARNQVEEWKPGWPMVDRFQKTMA